MKNKKYDFKKENCFFLDYNKTMAIGLKCKPMKTTRISLDLLKDAIELIEKSGKDVAEIGIINGDVMWIGDEDAQAGIIIAPRIKDGQKR